MTDDTRLARSQNSTPGGKCVRRIDVPLTEDLDDAITAQPEVSALPGDDEVTPRFVFVTEVSGQKPAGYDHLGHALRTVRHSGEGWR